MRIDSSYNIEWKKQGTIYDMISGVLVKQHGRKSPEMLTGFILDCGIVGDFYFLLYLSVFSVINNITSITYH